jgi:hypothetical protein
VKRMREGRKSGREGSRGRGYYKKKEKSGRR